MPNIKEKSPLEKGPEIIKDIEDLTSNEFPGLIPEEPVVNDKPEKKEDNGNLQNTDF